MMKIKCNIKNGRYIVLTIMMCVLSSCAFHDKSEDYKAVESMAEECYKTVLLENGDFISTDLQNRNLNLGDIKDVVTDDDSIVVEIPQFAIIDLDNDGENEIVLWIQMNGVSDYGFEVLRYQNGVVYGYTLPYRGFMNLKTDGTFLFSGGAADLGIGKLKFSENGYNVDKLHYSEARYDSNNKLSVQYFGNGVPCSEEEFNVIVGNQEEKSNVNWYNLTDDSVNSAFENRFQ